MISHVSDPAMRRRHRILEIIRESPVHSQGEPQELLRKRGFAVTQPTLSRNLRELEIDAGGVQSKERVAIGVDLGAGHAPAHPMTCNLGPDYVALNAHYRS